MSDQLEQEQFLDVIAVEEAHERWQRALGELSVTPERVEIREAAGRILAEDVAASVDVPSFDRSNVDGFALVARDSWGASETAPRELALASSETITPGRLPQHEIRAGSLVPIATGAPIPRGADAVVMVEHTHRTDRGIAVERSVPPGANVTFAGTDIVRGEIVAWRGSVVTARDAGVIAATGIDEVTVARKPRVAIISTGDELIHPGSPHRPGSIYDSNAVILGATVEELGGSCISTTILPDDLRALERQIELDLERADIVLLSGGTSKGGGDLSYRAVSNLDPGIVVHGVALKPGKPICLALAGSTPVIILPGFPTSAVFTFHEFVAPMLMRMTGRRSASARSVEARSAIRVNSEKGRTEYSLVMLAEGPSGLVAYPIGKGSGSVTTFSRADGFFRIDRQEEIVERDQVVEVTLISGTYRPADLMVIGSQCSGLDHLLAELRAEGLSVRTMSVGSQGGAAAARRDECDLAGVHLLDPATGDWNDHLVDDDTFLLRGYRRMQGICSRPKDDRFSSDRWQASIKDRGVRMVNRNRGSGTRILIDEILDGTEPEGYSVEVRSHHAVAAAVLQNRADWGVCTENVAASAGLAFTPLRAEHYDFLVPRSRVVRPAVRRFIELLQSEEALRTLKRLGLDPYTRTGVLES